MQMEEARNSFTRGGTFLKQNHLQKATQPPRHRAGSRVCSHPAEDGGREHQKANVWWGADHRVMSSKGRNQVNSTRFLSWSLSTSRLLSSRGLQCAVFVACQRKADQALCRASCSASGQTEPVVPVSAGGFAQSRMSRRGQDNEHLTLTLLLPAIGSASRWEMCSNNQAYRGSNSSWYSQGSCQRNHSPPGQNHFHPINDPCYVAQCHCAILISLLMAAMAQRSSVNTAGSSLQLK